VWGGFALNVGIHAGGSDISGIIERCRSLRVDQICLSTSSIPRFDERGYVEANSLANALAALSEAGISVPTMLMNRWASPELLEGAPGAREEFNQLCETLAALGEASVRSLLFYVRLERAPSREPQQWRSLVAFYRKLGEEAEHCGVKVASHAFYRPYSAVRNTETLERLMAEAPNPYNGVTYCQGLYLSGDDIYEAIRRFQGRMFFAHARDLRRRGDAFDEVPPGEGDIDFTKVLRLLEEAGYEGLVCPEHLGPDKPGVDLEAEAVRYLRKLLAELER